MVYYVYIIYSESLDLFYKGQTSDLTDRMKRHNLKQEQATKNGAPWTIVWSTSKSSRSEAVILEQKLKNMSRKKLLDFIKKYDEGIAGPDAPDAAAVRRPGC